MSALYRISAEVAIEKASDSDPSGLSWSSQRKQA